MVSNGKKCCFVCFGSEAVALLFLAVWATVDRQKYDPIYRQIQCTTPKASIPVNLTHVLKYGLNATLEVSMACQNPNPYRIVMASSMHGSVGTMLVPNLTDFSSPPIVAGNVVFQEMVLRSESKGTSKMTQSAVLPPAFIEESLGYIMGHHNTFPAYMEIDVKTDVHADFMFISKTKKNALPKKYCGYYLGLNAAYTAISITSPMVCRNSFQDMQAEVDLLSFSEGAIGFVDNLDPSQGTLDRLQDEVGKGSASVMCVGYGLNVLFWSVVARTCYMSRRRAKEDSKQRTQLEGEQVSIAV